MMNQEIINNPALQSQMLLFQPSPKKLVFKGPFLGMTEAGRTRSPFGQDMPRIDLEDAEPVVQVMDNGDVRFRFYAPNAKTVEVAGIGGGFPRQRHPMEISDTGWWEAIVSGILPGFHYHEYFVDGNRLVNPDALCGYGCFYGINFFEKPGEADNFWMLQDVPHGDIRMELYRSSVTGREKCAWVYCPPGYDEENQPLPVLYIQHGVGETETGWIWQGKLPYIMDNLLNENRIHPMIIVMNAGYAFAEGEDPVFYPGDFDRELTQDCIPHIESRYRVLQDNHHRAVAGLSLGSAQAFLTAMKHPDLFCSVGVFSGGVPLKRTDHDFTGYFSHPETVNTDFDLIFISGGDDEGFLDRALPVIEELRQRGIRITDYHCPGHHVWDVWRHSLHAFVQKLFREEVSQ